VDAIAPLVESWFEKNRRKLPWRQSKHAYKIWVSEVMLQQTQVSTVIPYYERFLTAFPALSDLAQASESEVLSLWSGLGYYSRAKNLHRGAQYINLHHGGELPKTRQELLQVPGIGPYTAGAISCIAFGLKEPLVDGNVERVFARYFGFRKPLGSPEAKTFFWKKASDLVKSSKDPSSFNQGLMEIGSLVCVKSTPKCFSCPLQTNCTALKKNLTEKLPIKKKRKSPLSVHFIKLVIEQNGRFFTQQNSDTNWWSGLWDFPSFRISGVEDWFDEFEKKINGFKPHRFKELSHQKHTVTHHRLEVIPIHLKVKKRPKLAGRWVTLDELKDLPKSALVAKILAQHF